MSEVALHTTTEHINTAGTQHNDYPMMINQIKESVATVVAAQMMIFGSQGETKHDH